MSAEHFETVMVADMRTAPDGRTIEYAVPFTREPRFLDAHGHINRPADGTRTWAACHLYAEGAVKLAASTVRSDPMDGLTGDHPERREQAASVLEAAARLVRLLALDDAYDSTLTSESWERQLAAIRDAAAASPLTPSMEDPRD